MTSALRVPPVEITGVSGHLMKRFAKRMLGDVPESLGVMWQHKRVLTTLSRLGRKVDRWGQLDPQLRSFAHMAAAAQIGCSFCLDFGYFQARNDGLDLAKASQVPRWREATVFTLHVVANPDKLRHLDEAAELTRVVP